MLNMGMKKPKATSEATRGYCQLVEGSALLPRDIEAPDRSQQAHVTALCLPKTSSPHYVHWALLRISRRPASITGHADRLSRTVHRVGLRPAEPGGAPD